MRRMVGGALMMAGVVGLGAAAPPVPREMPGEAVYRSAGCAECHGVAGKGTEKGPSLVGVGGNFGRAKIVRQIREGGGEMPGFGEQLTAAEIEELGDWLVTWKVEAGRK